MADAPYKPSRREVIVNRIIALVLLIGFIIGIIVNNRSLLLADLVGMGVLVAIAARLALRSSGLPVYKQLFWLAIAWIAVVLASFAIERKPSAFTASLRAELIIAVGLLAIIRLISLVRTKRNLK